MSNTKDIYQTDYDGVFLYTGVANEFPFAPGTFNVPYCATTIAPPVAPAGFVPRLVEDGWELVEDHRSEMLVVVQSGEPYVVGQLADVDGHKLSYPGWGPLPPWLSVLASD